MNYLFFDIECADGKCAICEFGFVLTDEKFNILKKRNIIIDPECKFKLTGRKGQDDLKLSYEYDEYYRHYPFDDPYDFIKILMTQKNQMIFGHAVNNDIGFLFKDCSRYKLPLFDFIAYDIQKMLPVFDKHNKKYTSLEKAYIDLIPFETRNELVEHRACDDAMKTMFVLKAMIEELEFTPTELIEFCPKSTIRALEYYEQAKIRKNERKKINSKIGQTMWGLLYREHEPLLEKESSIGKFVTVSGEMKKHHEELAQLIEHIKNNGFVAYDRINGSDYLVVFDEKNKKEIISILRYPYSGKILTYQEFLEFKV